jgi:DNA-binding transcriptional ArsR family regulator
MKNVDRLLILAQALADPLRLSVLQHLMGGPATVSELMVVAEAAQSKVSNHLALLRRSGLVRPTRQGRQVVYELRDPSVAQLLESMNQLAGARPPTTYKSAPIAHARTC